MTDAASPIQEFNLLPDPRILPMLGEISLPQWQCLAELLDNSVDSFLHAKDAGTTVVSPEISITIPTIDNPAAKVVVRDNGPGMDAATLERAVRAGWSGNDPIHSLGLFGMGFNIATARLGSQTTVWTSKAEDPEECGVVIDFDALRAQKNFKAPRLTRSKADKSRHGTEVTIEKLKPDQRAWFASANNRSTLQKRLQRAYSAMLVPSGIPTSFTLQVNGRAVAARPHCVWGGDGNPARTISTPRLGTVDAFQPVDVSLPDRPYCVACWQWVPAQEAACPSCGKATNVVTRTRRVYGWLGLQRYVHESDFGIDFIRHGRKIEIANKDLFRWIAADGQEEPEYPIDDPRDRGRIVGEIHLDHCRVPYMKDRFERSDPAWEEMVRIVRGEGPLRPDKAAALGFGTNASPLFKLFQAFRRNSPKPKQAGAYARLLVVPNNDRAFEMAQRFYAGEAAYQTDAEWAKLVEEADRELLKGSGTPGDGGGDLTGFGDTGSGGAPAPGPGTPPPAPPPVPPPPAREPIPSLTREFKDDATNQRWNVKAYRGTTADPLLADQRPWRLHRAPQGHFDFVVDSAHAIFNSMTMTTVDALLAELAWAAADAERQNPNPTPFAKILAALRERYGAETKLDAEAHSADARSTIASIARSLRKSVKAGEGRTLFDDLTPLEREQIQSRMASRSVPGPQQVIDSGGFLEYAPTGTVLRFVQQYPEFFFDGKYWIDEFETLNYGSQATTDEARSVLLGRYLSLLSDAAWLADSDPSELNTATRSRLHRAVLALDLLEPARDPEGEP